MKKKNDQLTCLSKHKLLKPKVIVRLRMKKKVEQKKLVP